MPNQTNDDLPSNSHAAKTTGNAMLSEEKLDIKQNEPKPGLAKRFAKQFFQMGLKDMWGHLKDDIVTPSLKNIASDMIVGAKDLMLFGSDVKTEAKNGQTDYRKASEGPSSKERQNFDFRNVVVDSRERAIGVIVAMQEWATKYEEVSVAKFYSEAGIEDSFADYSWGWKNASISGKPEQYIRQTGRGWTFTLPQVTKLSK